MNFDTKIIVSVMAGMALMGVTYWAINRLPAGNIVTDTVKKAKAISQTK